jgi:hypothetical protein
MHVLQFLSLLEIDEREKKLAQTSAPPQNMHYPSILEYNTNKFQNNYKIEDLTYPIKLLQLK